MAKLALLIGMDAGQPSLNSQPVTRQDIATLEHVLRHRDIGHFTQVITLNNPEPVAVQEAIEALCSDRNQDDLVLFYFLGQTILADRGKLFLKTPVTRQDAQGKLVKSTAVPTDFLQDVMNDSWAQAQVVILDCGFAGSQNGQAGQEQSVISMVQQQLGGPGRMILTSAALIQSSDEQSSEGSYTKYLVEGLETGAADLDQDGLISLDELHEFTRRKVQQSAPAEKPAIYKTTPNQQIWVAKAPTNDPKLRYRQAVEQCASAGEISIVSRSVLDLLRGQLGLSTGVATAIEGQVLKPYQTYQKNLQRYAQLVVKAIQQEYPVQDETRDRLNRVQQVLGLRDQDIAPVEAQVARQVKLDPAGAVISAPLQLKTDLNHDPVASRDSVDPLNGNVSVASRTTTLALTETIGTAAKTDLTPVSTQKNSRLLIIAGTTVLLALVASVYSWRQWQVAQSLQSIQMLVAQRDYEACLSQVQTLPEGLRRSPQIQKLLSQCQAGATWQNIQVQTLPGHEASVWSVAISPNGQTLASGSDDTTIKLWNLQTGKLLRTLSGHSSYVLSVAISPDGQTLASASWDKTIKIWHLPTGKLLRTLSGHSHEVWSVVFSPDGQTLASSSNDTTIKLWNLETGKLLRTLSGHKSDVLSVVVSPDGQTLASASKDRTIKLWRLSSGKLLRTLSAHSDLLRSVSFSPDGQTLASASWDKTIKVWHLPTGKLLQTLSGHANYVNSVVFSPDGQTLASGSDDYTIKLWNLRSGKLLRTLPRHANYVNSAVFSPNGKALISGSQDEQIKIWRR